MIKCTVFDLDNTVYDYNLCHKKAMKKLEDFACNEFEISPDFFYKSFCNAKERVKIQLGNTGSSHNRMLYMQLFLEEIGRKPVGKALEMYDIYWNAILGEMKLFDYVIPLMDELKRRGITIAVLTDLTAHIQHRKIRKLGIDGYVDIIVTSEEVGEEKPSSIVFRKLREKCAVLYSEMLMIGDSEMKDIVGAENVGMHSLLFTCELTKSMKSKCLGYIDDQVDEKDVRHKRNIEIHG